ncbi:nucleoside diphosphate kinase homolog 7-like isoform X2 [Apostichopus japonicus]|uniref:nucleoside diphosphate kinase homolog 7-like isoform X2 n=1 Tax=Stichopus japonicus TaxID=307972 RepID=UPI003AB1E0E8
MASEDGRFAFDAEWYDQHAALIRKYQFLFYPKDSTVEMFDIKNRRLFLKRSCIDGLKFEDLYVGATVNVNSRTLTLVDYSDEYTKNILSSKKEKTLALIKPDAVLKFGQIFNAIYQSRFLVCNAKMVRLTRGEAEEFYAEHVGKAFFDNLVRFMTSGPIIAMELMKDGAIGAWRELLGPTDSSKARSDAPNSIRAMFGTDQTQNACHGSDSTMSAQRECNFFFGSKVRRNTAMHQGSTCCIIKPSAVDTNKAGEIMAAITAQGYQVTGLQMFHMEKANAEEFFEVYKGVVAEYIDMVNELSSGPCIVLEVTGQGDNIPTKFREFVGPADPEIARHLRPNTLRAKFGHTKINNAIHCTDLPEDGALEVEYFFRILSD